MVKTRYNKISIVIQQYNALAFLEMQAHRWEPWS